MRGFMISYTTGAVRCAAPVVSTFAAVLLASSAAILLASNDAYAAPAIRTNQANVVPQCVTPDKLMAFVRDRNPTVDPRYRDIANWYKHFGEAWNVRWDYAFYQMILETNALKYRRGDGRRGDVRDKQNNFAGIGATGHGAPGEKFPDIKSGVHAQIQHLVAYSGERLADPVAARTQLVQDSVIETSKRLRRPVTFGDLARRWAADRAYAKSIDAVAEQFRTGYCTQAQSASALKAVPAPQPASRRKLAAFAVPSRLGGPQPQMLAGPDDLPWTGEADPSPAITAQQDVPPAEPPSEGGNKPNHKTTEKHHKVPPVRTIWSRDGNVPPAVEAPRAASADPVPPSKPAGTPKPETAVKPATKVDAETGSAPDGSDTPILPHFKIGPVMPSPSKLGGPVDALPLAATSAAQLTTAQPANLQSVVRFKEIITAEPQAAAPVSGPCRVLAASYGGKKTLLVRAHVGGETRYTALTVIDGFEKSMFDIYAKASAPNSEGGGAEIVGEYPTKDEALADARTNCPG
jgi:hypothetical protein